MAKHIDATKISLSPYREEPDHSPGLLHLDRLGKERYARLHWRNVEVSERVPLHFWKMREAAKEVEVARILGALKKKMRKVFGMVPEHIVGAEEEAQ